jgi:plastocyanin
MKKKLEGITKVLGLPVAVMLFTTAVQADVWQIAAGAQSADLGRQALAFLPNELWIHAGDSIQWSFPTAEIHTVTLLTSGQTRPPFPVGCPGMTPDVSSFDGSACVNSDTHCAEESNACSIIGQTYTVSFPKAGNFKFVCLVHADMTGVVHVLSPTAALPYDQDYYDRQAGNDATVLLADAALLADDRAAAAAETPGGKVAAGVGGIVATTGGGSHLISLSRFLPGTVVVRVGDTVEWTNLELSRNHTITFGTEPDDPQPPSTIITMDADGARHAVVSSPSDSVNSGFLIAAPQERVGLSQAPPGLTRFRVTFKAAGTFNYICALHDDIGMKGTVIVQP